MGHSGITSLDSLGNGTTEASLEPVQVEGLQDIIKVSAGRGFSAALSVPVALLWTVGHE